MAVQVVVSKGDRNWDSIREQTSQALLRISEFMEPDHDIEVKATGMLVRIMITEDVGYPRVFEFLHNEGYTVTIKEL